MNMPSAQTSKPWYREPWPWFLISLPATAVIAGLITAWLAVSTADGLVVGDYYKAGLAINQTLARDDTAQVLALKATMQVDKSVLALTLTGNLPTYPPALSLILSHPTRQGMDQVLALDHAGDGRYRTSMPVMPTGKWHAQLSDADSTWRLSGVLHTPFNQPVTLTSTAKPTVQQHQGE